MIRRRVVAGLVVFLVVAAGAARQPRAGVCEVLPEGSCPQVYQVHKGHRAAEQAFNLVVVSDGFRESQLDEFRCAVRTMVKILLQKAPYRTYACRLSIYRIDLASPPAQAGVEVAACTDVDPLPCAADPPASYTDWSCGGGSYGVPVYPADTVPCAVADVGTRLCAEGNECSLLLPSTDSAALDAAACVPDVNAVLVIARTGSYGGGARVNTSPLTPSVASVSLWAVNDTEWRWELARHELGHALFELHDEYVGSGGGECPYRADRNVVRGSAVDSGFAWQELCSPCTRSCNYAGTCATGAACANGEPCCTGTTADLDAGTVGLVEGACYNNCGYYRPSEACEMRDIGGEFCAGCLTAVEGFLAADGIDTCLPPAVSNPRRTDTE